MDPQTPPVSPDLASQSSEPILPKHRSHKMLLLLVVLVVLLLVSGGMYFLGQQSQPKLSPPLPPSALSEPSPVSQMDEMSDWETYINTTYNYSFEYPLDWEGSSVVADSPGIGLSPTSQMLDFSPQNNTEKYPVNLLSVQHLQLAPTYPQRSEVEINGKKVIKYHLSTDEFESDTYLFGDETHGYIEFLFRYTKGSKILETFSQILSTFEFVDNNQTINTCIDGFVLQEQPEFSLCTPVRFSLNEHNKTDLGLIVDFKSVTTQETLAVYENFIGGWGGNPCFQSLQTTLLGKTATQYMDIENLSNSEPGDANPVCGKIKEIVIAIPNEKWALGLVGNDINSVEFMKIKDSLQIK